MNKKQALSFIEKHGVVLASAKGPVPRLTDAIVNETIRGSWWAHHRSREIFAVLRDVSNSKDVLVCRLVNGKVTLIHRRLWPALVRLAKRFPARRIAQVHEEHTSSGRHITREVPFPDWVPGGVIEKAKRMSEEEALFEFGPLASVLI